MYLSPDHNRFSIESEFQFLKNAYIGFCLVFGTLFERTVYPQVWRRVVPGRPQRSASLRSAAVLAAAEVALLLLFGHHTTVAVRRGFHTEWLISRLRPLFFVY
jgi:hypothetical protein